MVIHYPDVVLTLSVEYNIIKRGSQTGYRIFKSAVSATFERFKKRS